MIEVPAIKRTSFKVESINYWTYSIDHKYGKDGWKNCFISPSGVLTVVKEDWHHVEEALKIIKALDREIREKVDAVEKSIRYEKQAVDDPFYNAEGKARHQKVLDRLSKTLKEMEKPHIEKDFKSVNMNRGLDAGEFLILHYGFVALSDYHVMYNTTTKQQREVLNCHVEVDDENEEVLVPFTKQQLAFKENRTKIMNKIKAAIRDHEYYNYSGNAFHCPSGIPRMGFQSSRARANHEYFLVRNDSFMTKAAKYGVRWPTNIIYNGRGNVTVDESSMLIPGFRSEEFNVKE